MIPLGIFSVFRTPSSSSMQKASAHDDALICSNAGLSVAAIKGAHLRQRSTLDSVLGNLARSVIESGRG